MNSNLFLMKIFLFIYIFCFPIFSLLAQSPPGKVIIKSYSNENGKCTSKIQEFDLNNGFSFNYDSITQTIVFDSSFSLIKDFGGIFNLMSSQKQEPPKPYLGIVFQEIPNKENESFGNSIEVTNVLPESSAEEAGIKIGDRILFIDNDKVVNLPQIVQKVQEKSVGDILKIKVERSGKIIELNAKLKARAENINNKLSSLGTINDNSRDLNFIESMTMPQFMIQRPSPRLGITVESMDSEMKKDLKIKKGNGIIITNVIEGSNAQIAGLKLNDVILKIDGIEVTTPLEVKNQVESKTVGSNLEIQLKRYGKSKKIIAVLNEFSGKWDESLGQSEFELNSFPDLNWIDENGNIVFIPLSIEEKIKLIEELKKTKIQQEEKDRK